MDLRKIIYVIRAISLSGIIRTIQYGFLRDRIEKRFSSKSTSLTRFLPGDISYITPIESGFCVKYEHAELELILLTQNLIKISWSPGKSPVPYTVAKKEWEPQKTKIMHTDSGYLLTCGKLEVDLDNFGGIIIKDLNGNIFRKDNPPIREGDEWRLTTTLGAAEHIYGLGERTSTSNIRPGSYVSWNTDPSGSYTTGKDPIYIGTPIYLSVSDNGCSLVYFENSYRSKFQVGDTFEASFSGGMLRYYLIFGSLQTIFFQLSELIGRPGIPPRWVLGYHQSRWGYRSEADIREVVKGFEEHNLPLSVIHLDIDYMDGFRVFTIDANRFPRMRQLSDDLNKKGIKLVASINPAVKRDKKYGVYIDGLQKDVFCKLPDGKIFNGISWPGWSVFPDFSNPITRKWWKEQYQKLLIEGISGIWHDMNEPASFAAWGDKTFPLTVTHFMEGQGGKHLEAHNLYGLLMNKAGYEALREDVPDKRPWILSRSGWAGSQRYAWTWTGDVDTSWEALRQTIPTILGLGLSGHAFSGVDIGGFSGSPGAELYLRWFQLATFMPFFRTHSAVGTRPREPWLFGETITKIIRKFLILRYKLIPFLYTLAWETSQTGYPLIRPVFWDNPEDHNLWDINDEFLVGDSLLIAPIMEENVHSRQITLPPGLWYSFWDDQQYFGSVRFDLPVSLETIPIFVKSGTLLPMDEAGDTYLHIYPANDKQSSSRIYNDTGDSFGPWRIDTLKLINKPNSMDILWESEGDYPIQYETVKLKIHGKRILEASIDGNPCTIQDNILVVAKFSTLNLKFE
jgi:alpha-glucosidase